MSGEITINNIEEEIWKDVIGYEGYYMVSNIGRVKSLDRIVPYRGGTSLKKGKLLKLYQGGHGYYVVGLCKGEGSKNTTVHSLVARHFVDGYQPKFDVNHIDGVKTNNHFTNLEWVSRGDNMRHAFAIGLAVNKGVQVTVISPSGESAHFPTIRSAAREINIHMNILRLHLASGKKTKEGYSFKAQQG